MPVIQTVHRMIYTVFPIKKKRNLESESERFVTGYCTLRHISTFTIVKKQLQRFRKFPST